mmetsp:Transcript_43420/g.68001  ORF Transcript_43420/g.68001 Transcript_43420/m.68001 type:complete len:194 (+) Transcript_43420:930-1511(+)
MVPDDLSAVSAAKDMIARWHDVIQGLGPKVGELAATKAALSARIQCFSGCNYGMKCRAPLMSAEEDSIQTIREFVQGEGLVSSQGMGKRRRTDQREGLNEQELKHEIRGLKELDGFGTNGGKAGQGKPGIIPQEKCKVCGKKASLYCKQCTVRIPATDKLKYYPLCNPLTGRPCVSVHMNTMFTRLEEGKSID